MGLTQVQFGARVRLTGNTIARMERDEMSIPAPLELLIGYVAREAGVDPAHGETGSGATAAKERAHGGKTRDSVRTDRKR